MHKKNTVQYLLSRKDILEGIMRGETALLKNQLLAMFKQKKK